MTDNEITQYMKDNNLTICKDNIIRKSLKNGKVNPSCPNELFQDLVIKVQNGEVLNYFQEKVYGSCILSLAEIVLNNRMMRHQNEEIKDESRGQMYEACVVNVPKYFDSNKGKAYSYAFRLCYVECVHVLERHNAEREFIEKLKEAYEEELLLSNSAKKISNVNIE